MTRGNGNSISKDLEDRLYNLIDQIRIKAVQKAEEKGTKYHIHGLCAVLGYNAEKHAYHFDTSVGRDIFAGRELYLHDPEALPALEEAMEIDGAILIDAEGKLLHSGRYMDPDREYKKNKNVLATYRKLQGSSDAGTRHLNAIALSAQQPDLQFHALKSDHPQLRVFKEGSIYRSTVPGEVEYESPVYQVVSGIDY